MSFTYLHPNQFQSNPFTSPQRKTQPINANKNPTQLPYTSYNQKSNFSNQDYMPRKGQDINGSYGQELNSSAYQRSTVSSRQQNPGLKLNEMSSDLARLKQQLNKIMNQADKFTNKTIKQSISNDNKNNITNSKQSSYTKNNNIESRNDIKTNSNSNLFGMNKLIESSRTPTSQLNSLSQQKYNIDSYMLSKTPRVINTSNSEKNIINYNYISFNNQNRLNAEEYSNQGIYSNINNNKMLFNQKNIQNTRIDHSIVNNNMNFVNYKPTLKIKEELNKIQGKYQTKNLKNQFDINKITQNVNNSQKIQSLQQKNTFIQQAVNVDNSINKYDDFYGVSKSNLNNNQSQNLIKKTQQQLNMFNNQKSELKKDNNLNDFILSGTQQQRSPIKQQFNIPSNNNNSNTILPKSNYLDIQKKISESSQQQKRTISSITPKLDYEYQQKIIQLQHERRKMRHELNNLQLQKENLEMMLQSQKSHKQGVMKKYHQIQGIFKSNKLELQDYQDKCKILENKLQIQLASKKHRSSNKIQNSFDEALREQIAEINKHKQKLQEKQEEINRLKDINTTHRRQIDALNNQIKIQQLKGASQVKELDQKHSIILQDKDNEIKTYKNLIQTLQSKLQVAVNENKTKDNFMVQHLTGRVKTGQEKQYIQSFFKKYTIEFPQNRISEKIKQELIEIEKLKQIIFELASKQ